MQIAFRVVAALAVLAALVISTAPTASAAEAQGWTCQDGVGGATCCECTRLPNLRVCRQATTSGQHSDKCGMDDASPCTGSCMLVLG